MSKINEKKIVQSTEYFEWTHECVSIDCCPSASPEMAYMPSVSLGVFP